MKNYEKKNSKRERILRYNVTYVLIIGVVAAIVTGFTMGFNNQMMKPAIALSVMIIAFSVAVVAMMRFLEGIASEEPQKSEQIL